MMRRWMLTLPVLGLLVLSVHAEKPLFTMGFMSDTHVGGRPMLDAVNRRRPKTLGCERVKAALELFRQLGCDYIVNVGDVCDLHYPEWYPEIRKTFDGVFAGAERKPVMWYVDAGHDVIGYRGHARTKFMEDRYPALDDMHRLLGAENPQRVWVTAVKGVPVVFFREWSDHDDAYERTLTEVTEANPGKPVIVIEHYPAFGTVMKSDMNGGYARRRVMLSKFPQVIHFSGHLHTAVRAESNLWQGDFTAVNCGCLFEWSYPSCGWAGDGISRQEYGVLLLEFYAKKAVIRRFDSRDGEELSPWTIPLPFDPKTAPYLLEERLRTAVVPEFAAGTKPALSVDAAKKVVRVEFPGIGAGADRAFGYRLTLNRVEGDTKRRVACHELIGDYWKSAGEREKTFVHEFGEEYFEGPGGYSVEVAAFDFLRTEGRAVSAAVAVPFGRKTDSVLPEPVVIENAKCGMCNTLGRVALPAELFGEGVKRRVVVDFTVDSSFPGWLLVALTGPNGGRALSPRIYARNEDRGPHRFVFDWTGTAAVPVPSVDFIAYGQYRMPGTAIKVTVSSIRVH